MYHCCKYLARFDCHIFLVGYNYAANTEYSSCTSGDVRLSGGTVPHHGRVEICVNNAWGTVCDRFWDTTDGNIVCRQLGYQNSGSSAICCISVSVEFSGIHVGSTPRHSSFFGVGSLPVLLGGLRCTGSEDSLIECVRDDQVLPGCSYLNIAGVECEGLYTN